MDSATNPNTLPDATENPLEYAVAHLKHGIRRGIYAPGQRLIEADLIRELGVKRGYVREALRILAGDGIVELVPQKGARVRRLKKADFAEMLPVLGGMLNTAIGLAIGRVSEPPFRQRLEDTMAQMRYWAEHRNSERFHIAAMPYHATLVEAADNRYLEYLNSKIHADVFQSQFAGEISMDSWDMYMDHFENLHAALMAGNLERARRLVEEHQNAMIDWFRSLDSPGSSARDSASPNT